MESLFSTQIKTVERFQERQWARRIDWIPARAYFSVSYILYSTYSAEDLVLPQSDFSVRWNLIDLFSFRAKLHQKVSPCLEIILRSD